LPRFELIRHTKEDIDFFAVNHPHQPFQKESLRLLGIPKKKILKISRFSHLEAKKLILPSMPGQTGKMPNWACRFLRGLFLKELSTNLNERIFISRKRCNRRHLVNEDEAFELLSKYGFKRVCLEEMPVLEQAKLFSNAEVIIGPHGSGMSNLVFASQNAKVIEIFSPKYVNPLFWHLSCEMRLKYYYIMGKGELIYEKQKVNENIEVDIKELKNILKLAGIQKN
jgi:capsular polysaccharide biosynthesis protein